MTNWLEVSLIVNGELAEAVAEVLARFAPDGVVTERDVKFTHAEDEGTPVRDVSVRAYLPADDKLEETRQKLEESLYYLGMIQPLPAPVFKPIADQNWMEAWKQHYEPIPIGKRLIIIPAWLESPDSTRIPIKIDPGMAFGTGTHPTTQLCLELLESFLDAQSSIVNRQSAIMDVGCGSSILSIAALKLGAASALGVDIDEAAVKASRENAAANGVAENLSLGLGSVAEVLAGRFGVRQASLVLANILAPVIIRLFEAGLDELVAPDGALILSGILQEQVESVVSAARSRGMKLVEKRQMGDWVAMRLER
ncbi:MAG: 50S ribosomal protein L11 methyltransferase [Anaerolineales bacterium]|nr:50S ribosomal protein L11 methyltransferase [Anaerolineales bacterium]